MAVEDKKAQALNMFGGLNMGQWKNFFLYQFLLSG
jgi:hypothetical protein